MQRLTTARLAGRVRSALVLGALGLASLLAGCHGVVSDGKAWFTRADAADAAPRLREGVWRGVSSLSSPCDVDERQPIAAWPDCAGAILVQKSDLIELSKDHGQLRRSSAPYVLAAGQPFILQIADSRGEHPQYEYLWVRVTGLDDQGRVVGLAGWRVLCDAPAANAPLYPGLAERDGDCTAGSVDALRAAAKASEADATSQAQVHWVRDGSK